MRLLFYRAILSSFADRQPAEGVPPTGWTARLVLQTDETRIREFMYSKGRLITAKGNMKK